MSEYLRELKKELMKITWKHAKDSKKVEDAQRNRYISLVKHAISLYLSTVFYRYFFPFLSEEDIECICNSAENYVIAMEVGKVSPFAKESSGNFDPQYHSVLSDENVSEAAKKVITVLRSVLARFRGIEAFYQIKVKIDAAEVMENQDTRRLEDIKAIDEQFGEGKAVVTDTKNNSFIIKFANKEYEISNSGNISEIQRVTDSTPGTLAGNGTETEPYLIESIEDLVFFAYDVSNGNTYQDEYVKMLYSLNFNADSSYINPNIENFCGYEGKLKYALTSENGFHGIGSLDIYDTDKHFYGYFDGNKCIISNLFINDL